MIQILIIYFFPIKLFCNITTRFTQNNPWCYINEFRIAYRKFSDWISCWNLHRACSFKCFDARNILKCLCWTIRNCPCIYPHIRHRAPFQRDCLPELYVSILSDLTHVRPISDSLHSPSSLFLMRTPVVSVHFELSSLHPHTRFVRLSVRTVPHQLLLSRVYKVARSHPQTILP